MIIIKDNGGRRMKRREFIKYGLILTAGTSVGVITSKECVRTYNELEKRIIYEYRKRVFERMIYESEKELLLKRISPEYAVEMILRGDGTYSIYDKSEILTAYKKILEEVNKIDSMQVMEYIESLLGTQLDNPSLLSYLVIYPSRSSLLIVYDPTTNKGVSTKITSFWESKYIASYKTFSLKKFYLDEFLISLLNSVF